MSFTGKNNGAVRHSRAPEGAEERLFLIGLSHVEFLRPREKLALVETLGSASRIFELPLAEISSLVGRRLTTGLWKPDDILKAASKTDEDLTGGPLGCIFYWNAAYPTQLREIYDPPVVLYYRGTLPDDGHPLAAIVGTRFPTGAGSSSAYRLGFELAREGVGVVSGLARGIDREAHEGCVEAGGYSIAVLGNGVDLIYPVSSRSAAAALLARGGAVVSEYPPGTPPLQYHFPARNRIISGLARAVVVVEAPLRSGALITAEYALEQGRDLYVHAAGLAGTAGAGTRGLAESGAPVIRGSEEILRDWGMVPRAAGSRSARKPAEHAGEELARSLAEEIDGTCALKGGETYWRG